MEDRRAILNPIKNNMDYAIQKYQHNTHTTISEHFLEHISWENTYLILYIVT